MNCKQCSELLVDYWREELPASSTTAVARHVQTCDSCGAALARLQQLAALLDTCEAPSTGMQQTFQARLAAEIANPDRFPEQKVPFRSRLFQALWPSRPFAALCYSFALLACGLVSGQLLPPASLGFAALDGNVPGSQLQMCLIPGPVNNEFL